MGVASHWLVITVMSVIFLLSSWEELGKMNYQLKGKSIKTKQRLLQSPPTTLSYTELGGVGPSIAQHLQSIKYDSEKCLPQFSTSPYTSQIIPPFQ